MSRDPNELQILGKSSVDAATAKLYWKFFVLKKYGGIYFERNVLVEKNFDHLRHQNNTFLKFSNTQTVSKELYMLSAPDHVDIQRLVNVFQVGFIIQIHIHYLSH